jgi:signal transduction histidine kinase
MIRTHASPLWIVLGGATLLGFFSAFQAAYAVALYDEKHQPFLMLLGMNLSYWYAWALLVPLVFWLGRRFPFERGRWVRSLCVHVPAVLLVTFLHVVLSQFATHLVMLATWDGPPKAMSWWSRVKMMYAQYFDWEALGYVAILGVAAARDFHRQAQDRTLRASQLETRLAEAQLQALQRQLHPHFLFNTLNAISALMHRDVDAADQMLMRLSDLLRIALDQPGVQEVALKDELDFLAKYLEIEQARFGDRLTVRFDVDPITLDAQVPNLILQPLVENSIRHAIAMQVGAGIVEIRASRAGDRLVLEVGDNGPGFGGRSQPPHGHGVGIANTRSRLEHLYAAEGRLEFGERPGGGLIVRVTVPFKAEEPLEAVDEAPEDIMGVA